MSSQSAASIFHWNLCSQASDQNGLIHQPTEGQMAKKAAKAPKKPAKAAKAPKAPRMPKTKANAPGAAAVQAAGPGHNSDKRTEDEIREGFLQHRTAWTHYKAKLAVVEKLGKDVKADLKADGYKVIQMQIADDLAGSPKAEAKIQMQVEDRLQVARWIGHPMGSQLDLFSQPDRTPAVDRSFDAGLQASMENKPRKAPHSPETPQAASWYAGYDKHQGELHKGFKAPKPDANGGGEKPEAVTSGERVTHSEFKQRLAETTAQETDGSPKVH